MGHNTGWWLGDAGRRNPRLTTITMGAGSAQAASLPIRMDSTDAATPERFIHLGTDDVGVVVAVGASGMQIVYLGAPIGEFDTVDLAHLADWPTPQAGFDALPPLPILPEASRGFQGVPGIVGHRSDGTASAPQMATPHVEVDEYRVTATAVDVDAELQSTTTVDIDPRSSIVRIAAAVTNLAQTRYHLGGLTRTVPIPRHGVEVMTLGGRWSNEFQAERHELQTGTVVIENRSGRTSFDRTPYLAVGSAGFSEEQGEVWSAHLAWSGNCTMRAEVLRDGRRILQAAELLLPGEVTLAPGESYEAPELFIAASAAGLNGTSAIFHRHLRQRPTHPERPRPVGLNTWEAVYFDHDLATLTALADRAEAVGVERFILDDGWFRGRRDDSAGLGDWFVDESVWPQGLGPLVDHVRGLGMEFGLWFEPEMVNPDSDLYRSHPDWALVNPAHDHAMFRKQLVLDLANPAVADYLFERIHAILGAHDISYIKWDSNRDLSAPQHAGRATVRAQVQALYRLMARIKGEHPTLEIESCASGGARVDHGVLAYTDRFWASDCNDALDRQRIQRGISYFVPPELVGAHIGPPRAHTTGRRHTLGFRSATAMFGHLGIEWNILDADDDDLATLTNLISLHKRLRPLLHTGTVHRFDHADPAINAHGVIAEDRRFGVLSVAQISTSHALATGPLRIPGLDPDARYDVQLIDPGSDALGKAKVQPAWVRAGAVQLGGSQLAGAGLPLPILFPESAVLIEISAA